MLFTGMAIYKGVSALADMITPGMAKEQAKEEMKKSGIFRAQKLVRIPGKVKMLGGTDLMELPLSKGEPLHIIYGRDSLMLTIPEMNALNGIEQWDSSESLAILRGVLIGQLMRRKAA